jgi:hypothetical protein
MGLTVHTCPFLNNICCGIIQPSNVFYALTTGVMNFLDKDKSLELFFTGIFGIVLLENFVIGNENFSARGLCYLWELHMLPLVLFGRMVIGEFFTSEFSDWGTSWLIPCTSS